MKLKICGITQADQFQALDSLGVDYLGVIFVPESPRCVTDDQRKAISSIIKEGDTAAEVIAVVKDVDIDFIRELVEEDGFRTIQLHGDEQPDYCQRLRRNFPEIHMIKAIHISDVFPRQIEIYRSIDSFLFDTPSSLGGGTGVAFNWSVLEEGEIHKPFFLAGGISLDSLPLLKEYLRSAHELRDGLIALDANSQLEDEPGVKNIERCQELIEEIHGWE